MGGPPAWTDDDRDKALAWQSIEDDRCPGCGNGLSETTDFARRTEWVAETVTCHACRTKAAKRQGTDDGDLMIVTLRGDHV